jgi:hypothetical protein
MTVWKVVFAMEALVIIAGNSLVVVSLASSRILRKKRYYFLLNLSLADLMVGMVTIPLYLYVLHTGYHGLMKKAFVFCDVFFGVESVLGLLTLSWERLYAICWPMKHRTVRKRTLLVLICATWITSTVTGIASLTRQSQAVFFFFIIPLLTLILILICISYVIIWIKVHVSHPVGESQHCRRAKHEKKLAMTLFIVTVLSLLAWLPLEVLNITIPLCNPCGENIEQIFYLAKFLQFGNSLINPLIYALRMPEFRSSLRKLFSRNSSGAKFRMTSSKKKSVHVTLV